MNTFPCPVCGTHIDISTLPQSMTASVMGSTKSDAKAKASRENGAKGGRPRKTIIATIQVGHQEPVSFPVKVPGRKVVLQSTFKGGKPVKCVAKKK